MIDQLILSINPNGSLFNLTMIFDLANTSLFYTLSNVWRNPILFFFKFRAKSHTYIQNNGYNKQKLVSLM